jgi:hypothetical protein
MAGDIEPGIRHALLLADVFFGVTARHCRTYPELNSSLFIKHAARGRRGH